MWPNLYVLERLAKDKQRELLQIAYDPLPRSPRRTSPRRRILLTVLALAAVLAGCLKGI